MIEVATQATFLYFILGVLVGMTIGSALRDFITEKLQGE